MAAPAIGVMITGKSDLDKIFAKGNAELQAFKKQTAASTAQISKITQAGRTGFGLVDKSVISLVHNSFDLFKNLSRIVDPLKIITGGATIAGLAAVEAQFAKLGLTQQNTARGLSMSLTNLARWQGATKIAGFTADTATSGVRATEIAVSGAKLGTNIPAAQYLNQMFHGPSWKKMSEQQIILAEADYLHSLHGSNLALAESDIGGAMGYSGDWVSFLAQGGKAVQGQYNQAAKNGAMTGPQADVLSPLGRGINSLEGAIEGFGTSITATLAPDITRALSGITDWLDKNRPVITSDIKGMFTDAENSLKGVDWSGDWKSFKAAASDVEKYLASIDWKKDWQQLKAALDDINSAAESMGGWKDILIAVVGILTASKVASIAAPFVALGAAITGLSGGGSGSFMALSRALRRIGFGVVAGDIVRTGLTDAGAPSSVADISGDIVTGAAFGSSIGGPAGAAAGAALGAAYWGLTDPAAIKKSANLPPDIKAAVDAYAKKYGVPPAFAEAQFRAEGGGYDITNPQSHAFGPAQLMPATAASLGVATSTAPGSGYDWHSNIEAGIKYDAGLMKHYNNQMALVAAGYNMGPGATDAWVKGGHDVTQLNSQTAGYIRQIQANGGIPLMQPVAEPGNIGFTMTPSGNHAGEYQAMDGKWEPLNTKPSDSEPVMFDSQTTNKDQHVAVDVNIRHDGSTLTRQRKASPGVTANVRVARVMPDTGWVAMP